MQRILQKNKRDEKQGVFPASGLLTVVIGPIPTGPSWEIKQISIKVLNTPTTETIANTYIGINASGVFISKSFTGNDDTDSNPNVTLRPGDSLACVWSGGTIGNIARLTIIYDEVGY